MMAPKDSVRESTRDLTPNSEGWVRRRDNSSSIRSDTRLIEIRTSTEAQRKERSDHKENIIANLIN